MYETNIQRFYIKLLSNLKKEEFIEKKTYEKAAGSARPAEPSAQLLSRALLPKTRGAHTARAAGRASAGYAGARAATVHRQ